jgi:hypothetical protein
MRSQPGEPRETAAALTEAGRQDFTPVVVRIDEVDQDDEITGTAAGAIRKVLGRLAAHSRSRCMSTAQRLDRAAIPAALNNASHLIWEPAAVLDAPPERSLIRWYSWTAGWMPPRALGRPEGGIAHLAQMARSRKCRRRSRNGCQGRPSARSGGDA